MELAQTLTEAVAGEIDPKAWVEQVLNAVLHLWKAVETEERGCFLRGWCYGALYGALDMGEPRLPNFSGSLGGPEQDDLDRAKWLEGVSQAGTDLADGTAGVALRNKILLRIAVDGGHPGTTLRRTWQAACDAADDQALAQAYDALSWPEPIGA